MISVHLLGNHGYISTHVSLLPVLGQCKARPFSFVRLSCLFQCPKAYFFKRGGGHITKPLLGHPILLRVKYTVYHER